MTGKQARVIREMKNNKLHILGISECRWTDFEKNFTYSGKAIIYSGRRDGKHYEGVAVIQSKAAAKSVIEYHPVNAIVMKARINRKTVKPSIIQVYSPTNEAGDEAKQDFYDAQQAELEKIPKHDLGDFNAKVGRDNNGYKRAMGKYGCGT
jgi:exonuclease III